MRRFIKVSLLVVTLLCLVFASQVAVEASPGWVSPTGFVDGSSVWTDEPLAFDETTGTYAYADGLKRLWTQPLELTCPEMSCDKVQIWVSRLLTTTSVIGVDVYYGSDWHNIYSGDIITDQFVEYPIGSEQLVTAMRIGFWASKESVDGCRIHEAEFWEVLPLDIDVGADPIDRGSLYGFGNTVFDMNNPANTSGVLHSVKVYAHENITGLIVGTFYYIGTGIYRCRDSEAIGNVESGAERTFTELSITVVEGDYIGCYYTAGSIECDTGGFAGIMTTPGEHIDPNDEANYDPQTSDAISLYGYGDIGAAPDITNLPIDQDFGVVSENNTYDTGLTYFTVTNNSSGAVTITIKATDFTGGNGWTLSDTATPGVDTVGLKAGLEGSDYTTIVRKTETFNTLVSGLATEGTQRWGLRLYTPTTYSDGIQKSTTVTLTATLD